MTTLSKKIIFSTGWKKKLYLFLLGSILTSAFPPFFLLPCAVVAFSIFYLILSVEKTPRSAFISGWWFGFGHFVSGLYWFANSLLVDATRFAWMIPFAVSLIPALLAIYIGFAAWINFHLRKKINGIFSFAAAWIFCEFIRMQLFSGFPWNLAGYIWTVSDSVLQFAAISGIFGLSFLAIIFASIPAVIFDISDKSIVISRKNLWQVLAVMVIISGIALWGYNRIPTQIADSGIDIRIVQPNIPQNLKWDPEAEKQNFWKLIDITKKPNEGFVPKIIIWPEAALPFILENEPEARKIIADAIPDDSILILGAIRKQDDKRGFKVWNSVQVLDSSGEIITYYDKTKLVPFGEFVPLRNIFPFINKITPGNTDFSRGEGAKVLKVKDTPPFSPLICYEVIFPFYRPAKVEKPEWILNVTNDAWFGVSPGPYQHLNMARVRAIEQGIPLVRAANNGVSAVIDKYGRIIHKLKLNDEGVIDADLPIKQ